AYGWPGNIRELRNVIERAIVLSLGRQIHLEDLPEQFRRLRNTFTHSAASGPTERPAHAPALTLAPTKDDAELFRISDALRRPHNNRLRAAGELGISRMTL